MQNIEDLPKTIICDIDGCILKHFGNLSDIIMSPPEILAGVKEKFEEWDKNSCKIILLTGRRENLREITEMQLNSFGLFWDVLVMGATRGQRILINDLKPDIATETAIAINIKRNEGLGSCPCV